MPRNVKKSPGGGRRKKAPKAKRVVPKVKKSRLRPMKERKAMKIRKKSF